MPRPRRRKDKPMFVATVSCDTKRRFKTEKQAKDAADFGMLENMSLDLGVYQCNICHFWHLTQRNK